MIENVLGGWIEVGNVILLTGADGLVKRVSKSVTTMTRGPIEVTK